MRAKKGEESKLKPFGSNQSGVTLVEVLAAVVLLGLAITLFVQLSETDLLASRSAKRAAMAIRLAENAMSVIRSDIASQNPNPRYPLDPNPFSCTNDNDKAACRELPDGFELTIKHQPYSGDADLSDPASESGREASMSGLVHYNGTKTLIVVTVKYG
jgi:prepilin-type N-terminal cleavage/methylation domain-containing protein